MINNLLIKFKIPVDLAFSVLAIPSAKILRTYRRLGSARLPKTTKVLKGIGVFPIVNHYYEPLFNDSELKQPLSQDRLLPGLDLNIEEQIDFQKTFSYAAELTAMKLEDESKEITDFCIKNNSFASGDADFLYQFIRTIKPSKVIEIGSGNSTKLASVALEKNFEESQKKSNHICIEPYEMDWLEQLKGVEVVRELVENCTLDWSKELGAGDLLFVDSSHIIRPQGDVLKEYLEIFPQLSSGVYIHIHDIFTPKDYLGTWIKDDVRFWNEQYLLEALLSNTDRYEIVGSLNHLKHTHYNHLKSICPYLSEDREPGSFYIRVK